MKQKTICIKLIFYTLIITCLIGLTKCQQKNKLNSNQKELSDQIEKEEQEKRESINGAVASIPDSIPPGFRFQEERSVDPQNPPTKIDLAGSLDNRKDLKLSDVVTKIKYIRLESLPDSSIHTDLKYKYRLAGDYIVASNLYGIHVFSKDGKFIQTVVKNEMTGVKMEPRIKKLLFNNDFFFQGGESTIWTKNNKLYYIYSNNYSGQRYLMEYDCSENYVNSDFSFEPEKPEKIIGQGIPVIDFNHGNTTPPKPRDSRGMFSKSPETIHKELTAFTPDGITYIDLKKNRSVEEIYNNTTASKIMFVRNSRGDTLTSFKKHELINNYTKTVKRTTDSGNKYVKKGSLFLRTDFNDTIFKVIPPNRLLPIYTLNLGQYKVSKQNGVDPGYSLQGKIIPQEWADAKNHIFLTFSKDNYDCPNNRKNKSIKIYHAIFFKDESKLYIVNREPTDYKKNVLENNIDGGPSVWPISYMAGENEDILVSLKGKDLIEHTQKSQFKDFNENSDKKKKLEEFVKSIKENDDVLMIVE